MNKGAPGVGSKKNSVSKPGTAGVLNQASPNRDQHGNILFAQKKQTLKQDLIHQQPPPNKEMDDYPQPAGELSQSDEDVDSDMDQVEEEAKYTKGYTH
jgi:hypothetical protein